MRLRDLYPLSWSIRESCSLSSKFVHLTYIYWAMLDGNQPSLHGTNLSCNSITLSWTSTVLWPSLYVTLFVPRLLLYWPSRIHRPRGIRWCPSPLNLFIFSMMICTSNVNPHSIRFIALCSYIISLITVIMKLVIMKLIISMLMSLSTIFFNLRLRNEK